MYKIRCGKCNLLLYESSKEERNVVCRDCAKEMSTEELKGKLIDEDNPVKCEHCNKIIDYEKDYPKGRKDIEICMQTHDNEIIGKHFCSNGCFKKYLKNLFENEATWEIPEEELMICDLCEEKIRDYPEHRMEFYENFDNSNTFCSDKCLRAFLKQQI